MSPTLNIQRHARDGPTNSSVSSLPTRLNGFDSTFSPSPSFSFFTPTFSNITSSSTSSSSASPPSSSTTSSGTSNSISSSIQSFSSTAFSSSSSSATLAFSNAVAVQSPTVASSSTSSTSLSTLSSSSDSSTSSSSSIQSSAITSLSYSVTTSLSISVTPAPLPFSATDTVASSNFSIMGPLITSPASTSSVSTPTSSNKSEALSASTSRFWSNKSAVAGTFTGVAIGALIAILGICLFLWRKRKAVHFRDRNLLEKYAISNPRPPSAASEHNSQDFSHEPMNAYANIDPGYYPMHDPFAGTAQNALYTGGASLPEITYHYAQDVNNQYPYYGDEANSNPQLSSGTRFTTTPASSQNPFEPAPSRNPFEPAIDTARERTQVSPDPNNEPVSRTSAAYPPSLDDSFYAVSTEGRTV